ncbi:hypothetical protein KCU92_g282, partial [Aureobasidium melanogenum]
MSALPLWVRVIVWLGISKLVLDIFALIEVFILRRRRRRRRPASAGNHDSSLFEDAPPSYTEAFYHNVSRVHKLQSFIAWRLAIEYHLDSRLLYRDREQEYFLGLLGMQFKSSKKVATTKEQITRDLFEPARMLGIPADVMEAFLFFTRFFVHADGPSMSLEIFVITYPQAVALRMAIDYTIIIDAAVTGKSPSVVTSIYKPSAANITSNRKRELKSHLNNTQRLFHRIVTVGKKRFIIINNRKRHESLGLDDESYSEDSYTEYSDSGQSEDNWSPSTPDKPSIYLSYRKHSFWPNVTTLARQSWRPCIALTDLRYSHNIRLSRDDLSTWILEPKPTSFQPRCVKVRPRGFACGLPDKRFKIWILVRIFTRSTNPTRNVDTDLSNNA